MSSDPTTKTVANQQVVFAPLSHNVGLFYAIYGLIEGSVTYFLERFDLKTYLKCLQDLKVSYLRVYTESDIIEIATKQEFAHKVLDLLNIYFW